MDPVKKLIADVGLDGGMCPGDPLEKWEFSLDRGKSWWPLDADPATRQRLIGEGVLIRISPTRSR
jgi:hypothetical protein